MIFKRLHHLRNSLDFRIRSSFRLGFPVTKPNPIDIHFQNEIRTLLDRIDWKPLLQEKRSLVIVDIGARNFCLAPLLKQYFEKFTTTLEIHGVEIDPYRRLRNLHTRYDYAKYYERVTPHSHYHPTSILNFSTPVDVALLFNPFVTVEPLLYWGLPLTQFLPDRIFAHVLTLLRPRGGVAVITSPTLEEIDAAIAFAQKAGFQVTRPKLWTPTGTSTLRRERYFCLALTTPEDPVTIKGSRKGTL